MISTRYRAIDPTDAPHLPRLRGLSEPARAAMRRVARVLRGTA